MNIIDTHTHIYLEEFDDDRKHIIEAAKSSGISNVLLPNIDSSSLGSLFRLCDMEPEFAYPMMGLHPTSVNNSYVSELKTIEQMLARRRYCAIGEIGIDLYWDKTYLEEQIEAFEKQLEWSIDMQLPVSIHTRNAFEYVFESIHKVGEEKLCGVFHCFTGGEAELKEIKKMSEFKIGINGVITFKNSDLPEMLHKYVPLDMILLETDAPYLAPVPYRGKRNEPVYMWETAKKLADIYNVGVETIADVTRHNTLELFRIR